MKVKIIIVLLVWFLSTLVLGYLAVFKQIPRPLAGVAVTLFILALFLVYLFNKPFREKMDNLTLQQITVIHIVRIVAGILFFRYAGELPPAFAVTASYGDLIAGLLAVGVLLLGEKKIYYYVFNWWGFLDLVNGLSMGMFFLVVGDPKIDSLLGLPLLPIPAFAVPILVFSHVLSFKKLSTLKKIRWFNRVSVLTNY